MIKMIIAGIALSCFLAFAMAATVAIYPPGPNFRKSEIIKIFFHSFFFWLFYWMTGIWLFTLTK